MPVALHVHVATGVSLHVGVDRTDPAHYGELRALRGAERDARSMAQLAEAQAFERRVVLVGEAATVEAARRELARAAGRLLPGDTFLLTFSGYGGAVPDALQDLPGRSCRTICFYDQQLVAQQVFADLAQFRAGVRIILVNDSCACVLSDSTGTTPPPIVADIRALPRDLALEVYRRHQLAYDAWQAQARAATRDRSPNPVIVLDACHDRQAAREDAFHGRFTSALLTVWNGGRYLQQPEPTYRDLLARVGDMLADPGQVPRLSLPLNDSGRGDQRPFVVGG